MKKRFALLCAVILLMLPVTIAWAEEVTYTTDTIVFEDGQSNLSVWPLSECSEWMAAKLDLDMPIDDESMAKAYLRQQEKFTFEWKPDASLSNYQTFSNTELSAERVPYFRINNLNRSLDGKTVQFVITYKASPGATPETCIVNHVLTWDKVIQKVTLTPDTLSYFVWGSSVYIRAESGQQGTVTLDYTREGEAPALYEWYKIQPETGVGVQIENVQKQITFPVEEGAYHYCLVTFGKDESAFNTMVHVAVYPPAAYDRIYQSYLNRFDSPTPHTPHTLPQTGDNAPVALWLGLMAASAAGITLLCARKKRSA